MTRAQHEARAERHRQDCEAAGIPVREPLRRQPIHIHLSEVGGHDVVVEQGRGTKWRARRIDTGEIVAHGALKTVIHELADMLPRASAERHWH